METFTAVLALITLPLSHAFHVPSSTGSIGSSSSRRSRQSLSKHRIIPDTIQQHQQHGRRRQREVQLFASSNNDDDEMNVGPGMEDAFKELEGLQSLGDENVPERPKGKPKEKDEAFAKAIEDLDLKDIISKADADAATPESQLELFKDMVSEIDAASSKEELIVADFKSDLEMADDESLPNIDTQIFLDKAIKEALKEAKEQNSDVDVTEAKESFLDNKEIMSEIEIIFDKANDELLEELEEIRIEQASLAKEQAERNSKASLEKIAETEQRMELAQGNMKKMLDRVNAETKSVENAIESLKRAQEDSDGGIDSQLVGLKSGGLVKQAALVGALLFTFRGGAETIGFVGGDPSHALPALIQGALAILCIIGFIFL